MPEVPTHYANLRVARNAPPEVIRAAYKALMQKHHPDRNPGDTDAERIVRLINEAYAVLNDPEQRARHDAWIASQKEQRLRAQLAQLGAPGKASAKAASPTPRRVWVGLALVLAFGLGMGLASQFTSQAKPPATVSWRR
ncbi:MULTISPECIES: J domain-containing protein [Pseudomonas]|uniref:J domain-containing protein n=1 Tax=Pseudomonas TaxID=286 RepID=UPI0015E445B4|nr:MULTISPECIES: J domain-containing protein [Pseudomonas]MBA1242134.1 J domain-containing protein [Pseudomonas japonica]MBA1288446.1 J domain-containing protein [Pseudomonas japonica]